MTDTAALNSGPGRSSEEALDSRPFPMMYEIGGPGGRPNPHPELTALKPIEERAKQEGHPSQVINIEGTYNYYTYSWMVPEGESETVTVENWAWLGAIAGLFAVLLLLVASTRLVKFLQFFLAKK